MRGDEVDQTCAPLYEALAEYAGGPWTGFHTPGHTGGRGLARGLPADLDLTEIVLRPGGPPIQDLVREAEELAAEAFGAGRTYFLTNGASIGVLASLLGTCAAGSSVLLGRDCHRSAVSACIIGDLRPRFIEPEQALDWAFTLGVAPARLAAEMRPGEAALITNPTYQGVVWDLGCLAGAGGTLLVDEAHGAHLAADGRGARAAGARAWVHGSHKTLVSLTQTGMLHLGPGAPVEAYAAWLATLASTSPSYPLLASLDLARRWSAGEGRRAWAEAGERLAGFRRELGRSGLRVLCDADLPAGAFLDPAKLTLAAPGGGYAAAAALFGEYGLQVEAAGCDWLTLLVTPFHSDQELARLKAALSAVIGPSGGGNGCPARPAHPPRRALWPREAFLGPRRLAPLADAAGEAAADSLCVYPPGIPLVWPGEVLDGETIAYIQAVSTAGGAVGGLQPGGFVPVVA